jgi:hypothetical protein
MAPHEDQEEPLQMLSKAINSIMSRPEAGPFLEPVDWRGLELFDYPDIVKNPMDLGTVKRKLERQQYQNAAECAEDVRLVWKNCMLFNTEKSDFWLLAKSLSKRFEDRYRKIKALYDCGDFKAEKSADGSESADADDRDDDEEEDEDGVDEDDEDDDDLVEDDEEAGSDLSPSSLKLRSMSAAAAGGIDAKASFAMDLLHLNGSELGTIITQLEEHCPQALRTSKEMNERMEILFDEIKDTSLFKKLTLYASERAAAHKRPIAAVMPIDDISNKRERSR